MLVIDIAISVLLLPGPLRGFTHIPLLTCLHTHACTHTHTLTDFISRTASIAIAISVSTYLTMNSL